MADRSTYQPFVTARWGRLLRTAYLLTHDWAAAEDLAQTALVKAWLAWPRLREEPEAYVRRIIVTTYTSWWRRRWRHREVSTDLLPDRAAPPDGAGEVDERDMVWQALRRLPARQRAVVVLRFFEDLSEAQTAELMGCSVGTVKSQTSKALTKLRVDASLEAALLGR